MKSFGLAVGITFIIFLCSCGNFGENADIHIYDVTDKTVKPVHVSDSFSPGLFVRNAQSVVSVDSKEKDFIAVQIFDREECGFFVQKISYKGDTIKQIKYRFGRDMDYGVENRLTVNYAMTKALILDNQGSLWLFDLESGNKTKVLNSFKTGICVWVNNFEFIAISHGLNGFRQGSRAFSGIPQNNVVSIYDTRDMKPRILAEGSVECLISPDRKVLLVVQEQTASCEIIDLVEKKREHVELPHISERFIVFGLMEKSLYYGTFSGEKCFVYQYDIKTKKQKEIYTYQNSEQVCVPRIRSSPFFKTGFLCSDDKLFTFSLSYQNEKISSSLIVLNIKEKKLEHVVSFPTIFGMVIGWDCKYLLLM